MRALPAHSYFQRARDIDAVLAVILHVIHRLVGGLDQRLRRSPPRRAASPRRPTRSDECRGRRRAGTDAPRSARGCARRPPPRPRCRCRAAPARTRRRRTAPRRRSRARSARITAAASTSARLPYRWPWRVVDRLEAVEVDEQQRQRPAASRRALGFAAQHLRQVARVVQLRQVVGDRQRLGALHAQRVVERDGAGLERQQQRRQRRRQRIAARATRALRSMPTSAPTVRPRPLSGNASAAAAAASREAPIRGQIHRRAAARPCRMTQLPHQRRRGLERRRQPSRAHRAHVARHRRPQTTSQDGRAATRRPAPTMASATRSGSRETLTARITSASTSARDSRPAASPASAADGWPGPPGRTSTANADRGPAHVYPADGVGEAAECRIPLNASILLKYSTLRRF